MRPTSHLLLLSLALLAAPAQASIFVFEAQLSGSQESPDVDTPGTGFTTITLDDALHTLRVEVAFSDLIGTTTASHIHIRPDSTTPNGPVVTELPSFTGFPLGVMSGTYDHTFDTSLLETWNPTFVTNNGGTAAGAELAFLTALQSGLGYLNVHTSFVGSGEIRGNLSAVPEPATWLMMLLGFGTIGLVFRRRQALEELSALR
jgi:hypothetical protein